jgi:CheY-like chemotaxis protein
MTVERIPTDVGRIANDVLELLRVNAVERHNDLVLRGRDAAPRRLLTDPKRLRQILLNLVSNALKFTAQGTVTVAIRRNPAEDRLEIDVEDDGLGMTPEQRDRLFQDFIQADDSTSRRFGGTGLGLSLSRRFAAALGGDIDVQSARGVGSTFTLRLPLEEASPGDERGNPDQDASRDTRPQGALAQGDDAGRLDGLRVLLAEDGADNRRLIEALLRRHGAQVEIAHDGAEAVAILTRADGRSDESYDIVLMDLEMPRLDGFDATRQLRAAGFARPIVALTAHALPEKLRAALDAGCDATESKPLRIDRLLGTLEQLGGDSRDPVGRRR